MNVQDYEIIVTVIEAEVEVSTSDIFTVIITEHGSSDAPVVPTSATVLPNKQDLFVPFNGQTIFTLTDIPNPASVVTCYINGQENNDVFTQSGATFTYIGLNYILTNTDLLTFIYQ